MLSLYHLFHILCSTLGCWSACDIAHHKLRYLPAQGHHIALYLVHLMRTAKSPSPIHDAVYGITWAHTKAGFSTPTHHHFVKQVVQVANRLLCKPVKRKLSSQGFVCQI